GLIVTPTCGDIRSFPCVGDGFGVGIERGAGVVAVVASGVVAVLVAVVRLVRPIPFVLALVALWPALVAFIVLDVAAVGERSRGFVVGADTGVGAIAALVVGRLVAFGVVAVEQALTGGALAGKRPLIVVSVGKERALLAAVAARHSLP